MNAWNTSIRENGSFNLKGCNLKCSHPRLLYRTPLWYWTLYVRIRCIPVSRLCRQLQTRVRPPVYASSEKSHSRSNVHQNGSCNILPDSAIIMRKSARMFRLTSCRTEPFSPEFVPRKPFSQESGENGWSDIVPHRAVLTDIP